MKNPFENLFKGKKVVTTEEKKEQPVAPTLDMPKMTQAEKDEYQKTHPDDPAYVPYSFAQEDIMNKVAAIEERQKQEKIDQVKNDIENSLNK
jgi:hypothetical protein